MTESSLDRITKDFIKKFRQSYELESVSETKDFEKFAVYCAVKQEYSSHLESEELENFFVGSGSDTGIDGLAIIVENQFLEEPDEIEDIIGKKDSVQVVFIFVQATVTKKFNSSKFRDFMIGVKELLYDYAKPEQRKTKTRNSNIDKKAKIASKLLEKTSIMREQPICKIYYLMGNDVESKLGINEQVVLSEKESISELNIFSRVDIEVKGTSYLHNLYRKTLAKPKVQIYFPRKVSLPQIDGINASYMGVLPFGEFKKLIIDENSGNIRNVFEENVRFFNEKFPTNTKIRETIEKGNIDKFVILNNGITIVTNKLTSSADYITLEDYQIVNGCQTSNILYQCRNHPEIDKLHLTLKIIHTENQTIANDITIATNNQAPVTYEALNSLVKFHKDLEFYYNARSYTVDKEQIYLYYERQEGKYEKDVNIESKSRIVSIMNQAKYYAAMFLDVPHEASAFRPRIKNKINSQTIFKYGDPLEPYYTSSVVHYELHKYLKNSRNEQIRQFNILRFHILMLFKYLIIGSELVNNNEQERMKESCEKILKVVQTKHKFLKVIDEATNIIEINLNQIIEREGTKKEINKASAFVQAIKNEVKDKYPQGMLK